MGVLTLSIEGGMVMSGKLKCCLAALAVLSILSLGGGAGTTGPGNPACRLRFGVQFPGERSTAPLDGRMLLLISADGSSEPRYQITDAAKPQKAFGLAVDGLKPGEAVGFDSPAFGSSLE